MREIHPLLPPPPGYVPPTLGARHAAGGERRRREAPEILDADRLARLDRAFAEAGGAEDRPSIAPARLLPAGAYLTQHLAQEHIGPGLSLDDPAVGTRAYAAREALFLPGGAVSLAA